MAQKYHQEIVVRIWKYKSVSHPGHASVAVRGTRISDLLEHKSMQYQILAALEQKNNLERDVVVDEEMIRKTCYISWWPGPGKPATYLEDKFRELAESTADKLEAGEIQPFAGQKRYEQWIGWRGGPQSKHRPKWAVSADTKFYLPGFSGQPPDAFNPLWGLSSRRIVQWWIDWKKSSKGAYTFVSATKNCAGVAGYALRAGGADAYASMPQAYSGLYVTPNTVHDWLVQVERKLQLLNQKTQELQRTLATYRRQHLMDARFKDTPATPQLMSKMEFKALTALSGEVRHGHIVEIDNALECYSACSGWEGESFNTRLAALVGIVDSAHAYFQKYAHNPVLAKRGLGVILLVKQVLEVLRTVA